MALVPCAGQTAHWARLLVAESHKELKAGVTPCDSFGCMMLKTHFANLHCTVALITEAGDVDANIFSSSDMDNSNHFQALHKCKQCL